MPGPEPRSTERAESARRWRRRGNGRRHPLGALALASLLPLLALSSPSAIPREVVVLALAAWAGLFAVAFLSARAAERRSRGEARVTPSAPRPSSRDA